MAMASTIALLLASGGFLYLDLTEFKRSLAAGLLTQAQIIGANSSAELAFKDEVAATDTLKSLSAEEDICAAALYTPEGKILAQWARTPADRDQIPPAPKADGVIATDDRLCVYSTVKADKQPVGVLYIDSTLGAWHHRRREYTYIVGLLLAAGALLAVGIGWRLQRIVSKPILQLVAGMRLVASEQNYGFRVVDNPGGEIGELSSGFNAMLDELELHRNELHRANEELEVRVQQRTEQLQQEIVERIAAEKSLNQSRQQIEEFFENASIGLLLIGPDGTIARANRMELQTMGYPAEEYVGKDYFRFNADPAAGRRLIDRLWNGESLDACETQVICKDGSIKTIALSGNVRLNEEGQIVHARCFTRDITALKEAEAAERARLEAERASSAKSEFLSRMSHELRTPMNAILGFAQLLQLEDLTEEEEESVSQIRSAGEHLLRLINEVLDISRIEAGALTISLEPVSLQDVTAEVASLIMPLAQQREITVSVELGEFTAGHVLADRQRLTQIILNLVSNAVKYNRKSGSVWIRASQLPGSLLRISVVDTGPGIPANRLHQIFQPFERLGAEVTAIEGTGLGLAFSKRLVEAMGGSIGFETGEGGSTFYVDLPSVQSQMAILEQARQEVTAAAKLPAGEQRCVLLIEDNLSNIRLMEKIFQAREDVKLLVALQGHLGFELAVQHTPDLILLDLNLPDCHGIDLLKRLKGLDETADIPIVVVSADATQSQIAKLIATGALKYLTKPVNVRELLSTVDEVFSLKAIERGTPARRPGPDGTKEDKVA